MTHYFRDKQTLIHDVICYQAEATLAQHRAPELNGFATFASLRLWADLITERQRDAGKRRAHQRRRPARTLRLSEGGARIGRSSDDHDLRGGATAMMTSSKRPATDR
jgi:hypothetical protein